MVFSERTVLITVSNRLIELYEELNVRLSCVLKSTSNKPRANHYDVLCASVLFNGQVIVE